ncbi:hypothetical protein MTR67_023010 [Solanum verrucosum]|uniref:Uncharacterized protein n=1 Tax=Solanum verrucosum TaxID=315347 RepID=A0AAF0QYX4_SOLVR|nr:hypothetical protein MTR67_023010 [Solanum verrucosum]
MKNDIAEFVAKWINCQQVKVEHQKPGGLSYDICIPTWKWKYLYRDFIVGLPLTRQKHYSIWVIMDRMTKLAHFIPTDGQAERTIKTFEDMLRECVIYFKGNMDNYFPLIEFVFINSYNSRIGMAPLDALYGRRCRSLIGLFEVGEVISDWSRVGIGGFLGNLAYSRKVENTLMSSKLICRCLKERL